MLEVSTSDASDTMNFWNNLVNIYDKLSSSLRTFLLRLQVRRTLKGVFLCAACLLLVAETQWPSHCKCELVWNWTN